jgi:two-component system sensor histidine kinase AlgZ
MNITTTENSIGFLPELCTPQAVLRVMVGAEVLALVLALTSSSATYQASILRLGLTSLFVQWVALSSTLTICLLSNKIKRLPVIKFAAAVSGIVVAFTIGASVLAIMMDSYQKVGRDK